jgi:hypothetical protein
MPDIPQDPLASDLDFHGTRLIYHTIFVISLLSVHGLVCCIYICFACCTLFSFVRSSFSSLGYGQSPVAHDTIIDFFLDFCCHLYLPSIALKSVQPTVRRVCVKCVVSLPLTTGDLHASGYIWKRKVRKDAAVLRARFNNISDPWSAVWFFPSSAPNDSRMSRASDSQHSFAH